MAVTSGDNIRIIAKMSHGGSDIQNVYHMQVTGTGFGTNEAFLSDVADFMDTLYSNIDQNMSDNITFDTIEAYNLTQDEFIGQTSWPVLVTGFSATGECPHQLAPLVLFNTDVLKSQGRKYLPPLVNTAIDDDGTIVDAVLTNITAFAADLTANLIESTWTGVFGNHREVGDVFIEWTTAQIRDFFATQRRRYLGIGS